MLQLRLDYRSLENVTVRFFLQCYRGLGDNTSRCTDSINTCRVLPYSKVSHGATARAASSLRLHVVYWGV